MRIKSDMEGCNIKAYELIESSISIGEVSEDGECTITVDPTEYVSQFSTLRGHSHTISEGPRTVTLILDPSVGKWKLKALVNTGTGYDTYVDFAVTCQQ